MRQEISPASVTLLGENPLTISSVEATASGLSEAARFFAYVGELAFVEAGPLNAEAWLRQNLPSGGSLSGGAELDLYGTEEEHAFVIIGTAVPEDENAD